MAIFGNINEDTEEMFDESGDILDSMMESCDDLLTALDALSESTATQRHYGCDTKSLSRDAKRLVPELDEKFGNFTKKHPGLAKNYVKSIGKAYGSGKSDKYADNFIDGEGVGRFVNIGKNLDDRQKEIAKHVGKAYSRGSTGYDLKKAAQAGVDVKGTYDKAHAKAAAKAEKKKAIKETCLFILSALDEI